MTEEDERRRRERRSSLVDRKEIPLLALRRDSAASKARSCWLLLRLRLPRGDRNPLNTSRMDR